MNTLRIIQKLSKTGQILSQIMFACSVAGICISIICILLLITDIQIPGIKVMTMDVFPLAMPKINDRSTYAAMTAMMIFCTGEAVLSKSAELYFRHELKDGTPFCFSGAKNMQRLGVLTVIIPVISQVLIEIANSAMEEKFTDAISFEINCGDSVILGIVFLFLSLIFRYGAEIMKESDC